MKYLHPITAGALVLLLLLGGCSEDIATNVPLDPDTAAKVGRLSIADLEATSAAGGILLTWSLDPPEPNYESFDEAHNTA